MHCQNNSDIEHHANIEDLVVKEFTFNHDGSLYYVGMNVQLIGSLNQFKFAVLKFNLTSKQRIELHLDRGRLFYAKNRMFGLNESNYYQFEPKVVKLASVAYPPVVKSNPTFTP
jgi:hypothetical protein